MSAKTCSHGMPSPASCLLCMEDDGVGPPPKRVSDLPDLEFYFVAKLPGTCPSCQGEIQPDQRIAKTSDDTYWCARCARKLSR